LILEKDQPSCIRQKGSRLDMAFAIRHKKQALLGVKIVKPETKDSTQLDMEVSPVQKLTANKIRHHL